MQSMNDANARFTQQLDHDRAALLAVSQAAAASLAFASSAPSRSAPDASSSAPEGGGYGPTGRGIDRGKGSSSGSGPTAKAAPTRRDADITDRLVARNLGTAVNAMDAQAQARQDTAAAADDNMNDASVRPVQRVAKPKPMSKTKRKTQG